MIMYFSLNDLTENIMIIDITQTEQKTETQLFKTTLNIMLILIYYGVMNRVKAHLNQMIK